MIEEIDYQDPIHIFACFANMIGSIFFDSRDTMATCGRYSFIAIDPYAILKSKNGWVNFQNQFFQDDPFNILKSELAKYSELNDSSVLPFQGGGAGYLGYDLFQHLENISVNLMDDMQFPDLIIGFYDVVLGFDHLLKRAWIVSKGYPEKTAKTKAHRAEKRLRWVLELIKKEKPTQQNLALIKDSHIKSNFDSENYQIAVRKIINYILAGDIFQANFSQRFLTDLPKGLSAFDLYQRLRLLNPAPFASFQNWGNVSLASASPERFLQVQNGKVETRPIKGTKQRSNNKAEDQKLAQQLKLSEKDNAENIMIVDLLRNDLSRVCKINSIKVPNLCHLESYANVHHLVSVVTGELADGNDAIDLLKATFPGGSITGAPKIRAMEIISELEKIRRGPYCGCIGYFGFDGTMDSSVTIRTFCIKENLVTFQAGGAVVADSDPILEYEESLIKAERLKKALTIPLMSEMSV